MRHRRWGRLTIVLVLCVLAVLISIMLRIVSQPAPQPQNHFPGGGGPQSLRAK